MLANCADPDQTADLEVVGSGSAMFSILSASFGGITTMFKFKDNYSNVLGVSKKIKLLQ